MVRPATSLVMKVEDLDFLLWKVRYKEGTWRRGEFAYMV